MHKYSKLVIKNINNRLAELDRRPAWLAGKSGLTKGTISRILSGENVPNLDTLDQIATALGVPLSDLVLESPKDSKEIANQISALATQIDRQMRESASQSKEAAEWNQALLMLDPGEISRDLFRKWDALDQLERANFGRSLEIIIERLQEMAKTGNECLSDTKRELIDLIIRLDDDSLAESVLGVLRKAAPATDKSQNRRST